MLFLLEGRLAGPTARSLRAERADPLGHRADRLIGRLAQDFRRVDAIRRGYRRAASGRPPRARAGRSAARPARPAQAPARASACGAVAALETRKPVRWARSSSRLAVDGVLRDGARDRDARLSAQNVTPDGHRSAPGDQVPAKADR